MERQCKYIVHISYSTCEYDIALGIVKAVVGSPRTGEVTIGDTVFIFFSFHDFCVCEYDPFGSAVVDEHCIFKIPKKRFDTALVLPVLKYGCIACHIDSLVRNHHLKRICIYSNYNVFMVMSKILAKFDHKCSWYDVGRGCKRPMLADSHVFVAVTPNAFLLQIGHEVYRYNLDMHSILDVFGHDNIECLIKLTMEMNQLADVCYVHLSDITEIELNRPIKSRFFNIVSFS